MIGSESSYCCMRLLLQPYTSVHLLIEPLLHPYLTQYAADDLPADHSLHAHGLWGALGALHDVTQP